MKQQGSGGKNHYEKKNGIWCKKWGISACNRNSFYNLYKNLRNLTYLHIKQKQKQKDTYTQNTLFTEHITHGSMR